MKKKTAIFLILFIALATQGSSCGGGEDGGNVTVITNQEQQVNPDSDANDPETGDCDRACTLECGPSGGFTFEVKLQCFTEEETLQSGSAATISDLPVECLDRPLPNCSSEAA